LKQRQEIENAIEEIGALPVAATKALAALEAEDLSLDEVIAAVGGDPGLLANVLRLANSSVRYPNTEPVHSVLDAVLRLGIEEVGELVLAASTTPLLYRPVRGYGLSAGNLSRYGLAVARAAEQLAEAVGRVVPDHLFSAAMLSNVGKLVLGTALEVDAEEVISYAREEQLSFDAAERAVLGIDHAEAGALLLARWGIGDPVISVVRHHHQPDRYDGDRTAVDFVHLADSLCMLALGAGVDGLRYAAPEALARRYGLRNNTLEVVLASVIGELDHAHGALLDEPPGAS